MTDLEVIDDAIEFVNALNQGTNSFALFESVLMQLKYVRSLLDGTNTDSSRISSLILDVLGAREFDGFPPLADRLLAAATIATRWELAQKTRSSSTVE